MKRTIYIFCLLVLCSRNGKSQLLNENFNANLPAGWIQSPASSWSLQPNFGISASSCILTENIDSAPGTRTISTMPLNLSGVTNLTVTFQVASIKNNFLNPDLVLYYDNGSGPQFLARWGAGFNPNTTYTLVGNGADYAPPLDAQNVYWEACSHTLAAVSGTAVRFIFVADLYNGGYVLLDDVLITGMISTDMGLSPNGPESAPWLFPNPAPGKQLGLKLEGIRQLQLTDGLGRSYSPAAIYTSGSIQQLDLSNLPAGIYYLNAITEDKSTFTARIRLE